MSQAKDYAQAKEDAEALRPREFTSDGLRASVNDTGGLRIYTSTASVTAKEALDFASYIFEVLGDGPPDEDVPF